MITKSDINKLLVALQFHNYEMIVGVWYRKFYDNVILEVDTSTERFLYEKAGITVTGATTANFSQNENFVVFECVCRLLEKGYKPKDIELEPTWKLGHTDKGGRADIWIRTKNQRGEIDSLLIIECKTAGREFEGAWRDTLEDGAQLFSYFQQEGTTKFLCLYSSDLIDDQIASEYHLINVQDNDDYLKTLKKPKTFSAASTVKERFAVWHDTYKCEYAKRGLFEEEIAPYKPGKNKYSTADLREIDHTSMQKKYHEFATILRKHNVSGHENAFDKLVNLFLAKVVDEKRNATDLKFYWKGIAYDDAYSLQDRLQYLYMIGMREFLGETVTYIDEATVKKAFGRFERDPDATKDAILRYFRQLKFFSNNDFSFIDVHNERLFNENAAILLKIVQMLEDVKLLTDEPNQFLGDLFEGFLDRGVKQSEGQFFTPLPIVRFIISSLPIQAMLRDAKEPPHVIDYACGAGHFLNEYAQQVKRIARDMYGADADEERAHYSAITGIEKEYRLSKVAKVAAFMYGEDDIQIIYADALARNPKAPEGAFDILVANPPYSVKGFLETLSEEERERYELTEAVSDLAKQNSIETFFVERTAQLLKPTGIAAIILPSSILSNGGGVYVKCREIILKNFDIIAIAEFGSGTFGKTGTNTITAFLRKKDAPPDFADHWRNRADAWFAAKHDGDEVFGDASALERYCEHRKFDFAEYKAFLSDGTPSSAANKYPELWKTDAFRAYRAAFAKTKKPKKATDDDIARLEAEFIRIQEKERLYYFLLADANPVDVLVIKMPNETKAAKEYLGYEWSAAKGNEGIKYIGVASGGQSSETDEDEDDTLARNKGIEGIKTPLFNNSNLFDAEKLNSLIRYNFNGTLSEIPESLQSFAKRIPLVEMLDFEAISFDKQFKTSAAEIYEAISKYPIEKLSNLCACINPSRADAKSIPKDTLVSFISMESLSNDGGIIEKEDKNISEVIKAGYTYFVEGDILIAKITPCMENGKCAIASGLTNGIGFGSSEFHVFRTNKKVLTKYLFAYLNRQIVRKIAASNMTGASGHRRVPVSFYENLPVPLPPLAVQEKVVADCEKVDEEYNTSCMTIEEYRSKIANVFKHLKVHSQSGGIKLMTIAPYVTKRIPYSAITPENYISTDNMLQQCEGVVPYDGKPSIDNVIEYRKGDVLVSNIRPYLKKAWLADRDGGCSPDVLVFRVADDKIIDPAFLGFCLKQDDFFDFMMAGKKGMKMPRGDKDAIPNYIIPVPPMAEQKKIVAEVSSYEAEIIKAQAVMDSVSARKQDILQKHGIILVSSDAPSSNP